jgi:GNAT superfamily N-acetyltransferase
MIKYREMTKADIPAGLSLCRAAGWNQLENDWEIFLDLDPHGSRVAVDENGKVVGTVTTIKYEDHFSWIGMVLVDPAKKRQGIGSQLLHEALKILSQQSTIKLDATPAGREIYLKLDFQDEYTLCRMMAHEVLIDESSAIRTTENNFTEILEKDKIVFGASRKVLLERIHRNNPEFSFTLNKGSTIAYGFGRKGFNFSQVGPVIADSTKEAIQVTSAALKNIKGPVILDVMHDSPFYHWLISIGFTEQRKLIRMFRGINAYPGVIEKQFAILGPEFG